MWLHNGSGAQDRPGNQIGKINRECRKGSQSPNAKPQRWASRGCMSPARWLLSMMVSLRPKLGLTNFVVFYLMRTIILYTLECCCCTNTDSLAGPVSRYGQVGLRLRSGRGPGHRDLAGREISSLAGRQPAHRFR